jgi:hypothetical protein
MELTDRLTRAKATSMSQDQNCSYQNLESLNKEMLGANKRTFFRNNFHPCQPKPSMEK